MSGCVTAEQNIARVAAMDDAACHSYGAATGTDAYFQCRMIKDQQHDQRQPIRRSAFSRRFPPQPRLDGRRHLPVAGDCRPPGLLKGVVRLRSPKTASWLQSSTAPSTASASRSAGRAKPPIRKRRCWETHHPPSFWRTNRKTFRVLKPKSRRTARQAGGYHPTGRPRNGRPSSPPETPAEASHQTIAGRPSS
jgi:hypothetical protein